MDNANDSTPVLDWQPVRNGVVLGKEGDTIGTVAYYVALGRSGVRYSVSLVGMRCVLRAVDPVTERLLHHDATTRTVTRAQRHAERYEHAACAALRQAEQQR